MQKPGVYFKALAHQFRSELGAIKIKENSVRVRHASRLVLYFLLQINGDARVISCRPVAYARKAWKTMRLRVVADDRCILLLRLRRSFRRVIGNWRVRSVFSCTQTLLPSWALPWRFGLERTFCHRRIINFGNGLARFLRA